MLGDYERTRRPVVTGVLATTDRITTAATVRNAVSRTVGKAPSVRHALVMNLSELTNR